MTLVLTAPERIAVMLEDIEDMKHAFWTHQKAIDTAVRPCCLVRIDEGSFPANGNTDIEAEETYVIDYIGYPFDQGEAHNWELQARQHAYDIYLYFFQRPSLQFSNNLGNQPATLIGLNGVKWSRFSRRSPIALMTGNGIEQPFWGFTYSLGVFSGRNVREILVPRT